MHYNTILELIVASPLLIGFMLDSIVGDPYWLLHPIRLFGNAINWFEQRLNQGSKRFWNGMATTILLVAATYLAFSIISWLIQLHPHTHLVLGAILVFYGLANRNLIDEAIRVEQALGQSLEEGRRRVGYIVGRETDQLSEQQIRVATLETLSENLSDGVIAPLFYFAIGGIPLMFAYKMINTLDSMIGYKSERYKEFGHFAAKLDDVANYIPARITALLMIVCSMNWRALAFVIKYHNKHSSPNAGFPEAALAGILNCRFGGPNRYKGELVDKPYIGKNDREVKAADIYVACIINFVVAVVMVGGVIVIKPLF